MRRLSNIFWGIILILIAAGLILYKMGFGFMSFIPSVSFWQLVLAIAFICIFINSLIELNFGGVFFSAAFFCIVFASQLHVEKLVPWTVLIAALILTIAMEMIFPGSKRSKHIYAHGSVTSDEVSGERIYESAHFTGASKYIRSENFKSAKLVSSFAGMEVYFDKVKVPEGEATIELYSKFGGVKLFIPASWRIINELNSVAGAVDEQGTWTGETDVTVRLVGENKFGGVEIVRV